MHSPHIRLGHRAQKKTVKLRGATNARPRPSPPTGRKPPGGDQGGGGGGGGGGDDGGGGGGGDDGSSSQAPAPAPQDDPNQAGPDGGDGGGDDGGGDDPGDDGGDDGGDTDSSGEHYVMNQQGQPFHIARGALPSHEAGVDCRLRIWREANDVCGVARLDTSYGPVMLHARADARVVGRLLQRLQAGEPPAKAATDAVSATEQAVRTSLFTQAANVPTSTAHPSVATAGRLIDDLKTRDPAAIGCLRNLAAAEAQGDPKAAAGLAVVRSLAQNGAATTGCSGTFPAYHRAAISVSGAPKVLTAAQHARILQVLHTAVAAAQHAAVVRAAARPTPRALPVRAITHPAVRHA